jgi:uncharacterized protein (TIGR00369 family)
MIRSQSSLSDTRTRTVRWRDPTAVSARAVQLSGLDYLAAVIAGELPHPPMAELMNITFVAAEPGVVTFSCEPDESTYNPMGVVHGGLVCTLLDSVTVCALHTTLAPGQGITSIEIKVNFIRPVRLATGPLTATGRVVKAGSRVAFCEGSVQDEEGTILATATSTLVVLHDLSQPGRSGRSPTREGTGAGTSP